MEKLPVAEKEDSERESVEARASLPAQCSEWGILQSQCLLAFACAWWMEKLPVAVQAGSERESVEA